MDSDNSMGKACGWGRCEVEGINGEGDICNTFNDKDFKKLCQKQNVMVTSVKSYRTNRSGSKLYSSNSEEEEGGIFPTGQMGHQESRTSSFKGNFTPEG